jgi:hypothetical protein
LLPHGARDGSDPEVIERIALTGVFRIMNGDRDCDRGGDDQPDEHWPREEIRNGTLPPLDLLVGA